MSGRLPVLSGRAVVEALRKAGYTLHPGRGKGSHFFVTGGNPRRGIAVPNEREVKRGILHNILRSAELSAPEFLELL